MPACASINCTNRQFRGCGKTFHVFPLRHPAVLKQWLVNMKRDKWKPSKKSVLCSDHFEESCFDRTGQTTRLRADVVPTIFDFPAHLQKCKNKRKPPTIRHHSHEMVLKVDDQPVKEPKTLEVTTAVKYPNVSIIQADHSYFTSESPRSLKHKLNNACDKLCSMKKRLKYTQQKSRRLHKRVEKLVTIVKSLRDKKSVSENGAYLLSKIFMGAPSDPLCEENFTNQLDIFTKWSEHSRGDDIELL